MKSFTGSKVSLLFIGLLSITHVSLAAEDTWTKKTDMPTARYDFCAIAVNGKIYAFGGGLSFDTKTSLATVEEYDPATDSWTRKSDMPNPRQAFSTSVVNGKIYVIGGMVSQPGSGLRTVEEYDPATDTWKSKSSMPTARSKAASSVVNGKIYVIGGVASMPGSGLSAVEEYDPATDTWTRKANMPTARHSVVANTVNGRIYAIGGITNCTAANSLSTVEEYDPATDTWTTKASMPTARAALSASVIDGKIYAIGGARSYMSTVFSVVEEYDPATDSWMKKANMPTARISLCTGAVSRKIYAIGGSTASLPYSRIATVEEYTPVSAGLDSTWGSGSTAAINDYQFAGSATLTIHEQSKFADLLVTLLEPPVVDANGTQHVVATHTFTFADGSNITTSDQEIAAPTATPGLYTLTANMQVVSGTGIYEGVSGHLVANGTIDFAAQPPAAQFELAGVILEDTRGSGSTAAINDYQFQGTAALTIHGQEKSAYLLVTLLEPPVVDANGVQHVVATHTFTFADGSSFTTSDEETAEPTSTPGLYTLTANMQVMSGTGIYEWAGGCLAAYGTIDFAAQPPTAQFELVGAILENARGSGSTAAINDYQFQGTATLTIHGQEKSADVLVSVLAPPEVDANGVQHVVATHSFTFADGSSFTTSDEEIAEPTSTPGLYAITANMEVVSGTGIYEGVSGCLIANGTIDFAAQPPAAQFELAGVISVCGDINHPYPVGDLNQDCRVDYADLALLCAHWLEDNSP